MTEREIRTKGFNCDKIMEEVFGPDKGCEPYSENVQNPVATVQVQYPRPLMPTAKGLGEMVNGE
ncbi:MAG TPA: hypothetical protein VG895_01940 [Patescibacteria group bacterium]|nr:hypothetical protein [Patescibacteria group bacterium]